MPVDLIEKSCMRKIYIRLLPFAILSYFLAYIDRINVSFAALTMRGDLGISAGEYGFALGTFYWGYFIFEVPSNVVLEKVGARLWIARIMITWGILAGLTAIVTGSTSFGVVRFFLFLKLEFSVVHEFDDGGSCFGRDLDKVETLLLCDRAGVIGADLTEFVPVCSDQKNCA